MLCSNGFLVSLLIIILYFAGAIDADSDAANITFILLNDEATGANPLGYVLQRKRPVTRFSQQDLKDGTLFFAHHGKENKIENVILRGSKKVLCKCPLSIKTFGFGWILQRKRPVARFSLRDL